MPIEELRVLSDAVFGQRYRAELMLAIAESDGIVCMIDVAERLGVGASKLQRPWHSLVEAELIVRLSSGDSRRRYFGRVNSAAWDFVRELAARVSYIPHEHMRTETSQSGR